LTLRVFGVALVATLLFGLGFGALARTLVTQILRHEMHARAAALGEGMGVAVGDAVATGDRVGLHALLGDALQANDAIHYLLIVDRAGRIVAHTLGRQPSPAFLATIRDQRGPGKVVVMRTERGLIHDVVVPPRPGAGAEIHIGMKESRISDAVSELTGAFTSAAAAALFAGLLVAWRVSLSLVRPLRDMAQRADDIAHEALGDRNARETQADQLDSCRGDVAGLERSFNRMAESLQQSRERLAETQRQMIRTERMAALGTFVAGTAHAINNPLGGLRGCLEMMSANPGDIGRLRRYTHIGQEAVARIEELVRRLMLFVRQDGDAVLDYDVNDVLSGSLVLEARVKDGTVSVALDLDPRPCTVRGNPLQLEQALTNLVLNALQASPAGSLVRVRTSAGALVDEVRVDIEDQGPGVPAGERDRIFEPFFTTKPEGEGTGLGLWVAWRAVEGHGGRIEVSEAPGGGARFSVFLPRCNDAAIACPSEENAHA